MPVKLNTEFNYRTQVIGETPWEKIKTLRGFLEGRLRAAALEKVAELKYKAKLIEFESSEMFPAASIAFAVKEYVPPVNEVDGVYVQVPEAFVVAVPI